MHHCSDAGFETIVSIPISQHGRLMGEVDLSITTNLSYPLRTLAAGALAAHLAGAIESSAQCP